MGFGDKFLEAWNNATDQMREKASEIAAGAEKAKDWAEKKTIEGFEYGKKKAGEAYDWSKDKAIKTYDWSKDTAVKTYDWSKDTAVKTYDWSKDKAVKTYDWSKDKAIKTYDWSKDKAIKTYDWGKKKAIQTKEVAKEVTRKSTSAFGQGGIKGVKIVKETSDKISTEVKNVYNKAKKKFGDDKVNTNSCKDCNSNKSPDKKLDGKMLAWKNGKCQSVTSKNNIDLSQSNKCKKQRKNNKQQNDIVYVNGIQNTKEDHCNTLKKIMDSTCGKVTGVYNATDGKGIGYFGDAAQTEKDRELIISAQKGRPVYDSDGRNPAVTSLSQMIVRESKKGKKLEIWAHSQGGAITSLAVANAKNRLQMIQGKKNPLEKVKIKSFGSAAPSWTDGPEYEHYIHINDYTPLTFGLGDSSKSDSKKAGKGAKTIRFYGDPKTGEFKKFKGDSNDKDWVASPAANHNMVDTYIKSYEQFH